MSLVITVPVGADWTNINTESGIAAGTAMQVVNGSNTGLMIAENTTTPADTEGFPFGTIEEGAYVATILAGSDAIWVKALSQNTGVTVRVQEI